ncbi:DNA polymerase-3 subunit alpha (Gram-positive type) [Fusobacterium sp. PH5-44]
MRFKFNSDRFVKSFGKKITSVVESIDRFYELDENDPCTVEGDVFFYEEKNIEKLQKKLITFGITDYSNSMICSCFLPINSTLDINKKNYFSKHIKVSGTKKIDKFSRESKLMMCAINMFDKKIKKKSDNSERKMVELHTHTKMSEMVGVSSAKDIIKTAISYGHNAVAITDYSVVHSFPEAYKVTKENPDFKAILGCEMSLINDKENIVRNPKDIDFEDEIFVVFELETLGFNAHENEIIEIGAVKLKGTRIIESFSQLVNPKKPIPMKIQKLTGISNSMVSNEPGIEEVIPKFVEFVGDATMVAHNAMFDMGFIKRDIKKYLGMDYSPAVIDTLSMAKVLYPDLKGYGLKHINKQLGLSLEGNHRSVDFSKLIANMFIIFLNKFKEAGITNLKDFDSCFPKNLRKHESFNCVVLAKNKIGLKNLNKLVSMSHIDFYGNKRAKITKSQLEENREGLIIGCSLSGHALNHSELLEYYMRYDYEKIERYVDFYDYIELLPKEAYSEMYEEEGTGEISSLDAIEHMNKYFYNLGKSKNILMTGSSNVHYISESDAIIRSILLNSSGNIHNSKGIETDNKFYFRTTEELLDEFSYLGEEVSEEIVITNTNKIADMIEKINPIPDGFYPPKIENAENIIKEMTYEKAYRIYGDPLPDIVEKRIKRELDAIIGNGFSVLYLSAQKLVKKSLDNGYLVGSRGSVGSSLVAFMMGITEVNALFPHYICDNPQCKHSEFIEKEGVGVDLPDKICPNCGQMCRKDGFTIPFEVFMGFRGEKVPDIDLNFSRENQNEIHRYCEVLFGKENVFKAGTISTLAEKNAFGYVKKYFEDSINRKKELEKKGSIEIEDTEEELSGFDIGYTGEINTNDGPNNIEMRRLAQKVEGAKKTTGQHPGGMIIVPADKSIYDFCPVQKPANDQNNDSITTHFDYHVMDEQLVKLDILGHDDPTTIKLLQEYTGVDIYKVPLGDPETLKLFYSTESLKVTPDEIGSTVGTYGVPEFGTEFVRRMLVETKPKTFVELIRILGLSHGTNTWINNGQEIIKSGKATLSEIISVRDDIMNYLIDQGLENRDAFDIMEFVRKGKPAKEPEKWGKFSEIMKEKNVQDWYIESCRKIQYMFPKGHAVAYVLMAMRIAYFKVHYPLAFYAAYLSRKADDFNYELMRDILQVKERLKELKSIKEVLDPRKNTEQSLCEIIIEMNARNIHFLPLDIMLSDGYKFKIEDGKIRVPLLGLNGLGGAVIENIVKERKDGEFLSYEDLRNRTKMSVTVLEKLKDYSCIDSIF